MLAYLLVPAHKEVVRHVCISREALEVYSRGVGIPAAATQGVVATTVAFMVIVEVRKLNKHM